MHLPQLRRIRWAVRAALVLGVAASVAANVLHARPNPISQAIAAWPPLALLLTVELTSRIPMYRRALAACRVFATMAIAAIAAWVSYWHMAGVASRYGESHTSSYLLPISVDGLIVVASVSLVELAGRIRMIEDQGTEAAAATAGAERWTPAERSAQVARSAPEVRPVPVARPAPVPDPVRPSSPVPNPQFPTTPRPVPATTPAPYHEPAPLSAAGLANLADLAELDEIPEFADVSDGARGSVGQASPGQLAPVSPAVVAPKPAYVNGSTSLPPRHTAARAAVITPTRTVVTSSTRAPADTSAPRQRRPAQETAELADEIEAMHPEISQTELAKRLGISATRLRAVRREARGTRRIASRR